MGVVLGFMLAFDGAQLAANLLFGSPPYDPMTYLASALLLLLVGRYGLTYMDSIFQDWRNGGHMQLAFGLAALLYMGIVFGHSSQVSQAAPSDNPQKHFTLSISRPSAQSDSPDGCTLQVTYTNVSGQRLMVGRAGADRDYAITVKDGATSIAAKVRTPTATTPQGLPIPEFGSNFSFEVEPGEVVVESVDLCKHFQLESGHTYRIVAQKIFPPSMGGGSVSSNVLKFKVK